MPDATHPRDAAFPARWSQAFAALPIETPPAGAWARVAASLPAATPIARPARRARIAWAVAATLAVALPGAWLVRSAYREAPPSVDERAVAAEPVAHTASLPRVATMSVSTPRTAAVAPAPSPDAQVDDGPAAVRIAASPARRDVDRVAMSSAPRIAASIAHRDTRRVAARPAAVRAAPRTADADLALAGLLAESARLESLVGLARDDRMLNASAAVLAADAEDRIRGIDTALSAADLGETERVALWTRRVDALRELAGIEGTQRWLAAKGESYDDAIVRVD